MLVAMEDLLDTWPGTLLVISHDRYLLERITDNQYAVLEGHFTHLPNGVDQYLAIRAKQLAAPAATPSAVSAPTKPHSSLSGAELRNAEKEFASIERKIAKQQEDVKAIHAKMAEHDPNDYVGLGALAEEISKCEGTIADLEMRWLELSELLGY